MQLHVLAGLNVLRARLDHLLTLRCAHYLSGVDNLSVVQLTVGDDHLWRGNYVLAGDLNFLTLMVLLLLVLLLLLLLRLALYLDVVM